MARASAHWRSQAQSSASPRPASNSSSSGGPCSGSERMRLGNCSKPISAVSGGGRVYKLGVVAGWEFVRGGLCRRVLPVELWPQSPDRFCLRAPLEIAAGSAVLEVARFDDANGAPGRRVESPTPPRLATIGVR